MDIEKNAWSVNKQTKEKSQEEKQNDVKEDAEYDAMENRSTKDSEYVQYWRFYTVKCFKASSGDVACGPRY